MKRLLSIGAVVLLAGCGDANLSQLDTVMEEIRRIPAGQPPVIIPTIPEYQPVDYRYREEEFQLEALRLVGTLRMGGKQVALISAPDGSVYSVREGNYLGTNYGHITAIGPQEVRITERIFNQLQGWQERQASLTLNE